jgi:arylsulfatase A-like enzyme
VLWLLPSVAVLACARPSPAPPSILLVTLDTTRADRIGAYGHAEARTPTIDRLAQTGVLFENALAPTPITLPSHASLLTGVYPPAHGVRDNGQFTLSDDATLISEVLAERGWRTGAFVGAYVLDARFGLDQGFEVYDAPRFAADGGALGAARPAAAVVDAALAWVAGLPPGERAFAWVHLYDPHAPYRPPEPHATRHADPYDGEIAYVDQELGRLLEAMDERFGDAGLLTVVTSDHGEAFGEHGETTHGLFVYQTTLHVPLVVSGAGLEALAGSRIAEPVSLASLAPTLLALAGVAEASLPEARLSPMLEAAGGRASTAGEPLYLESYLPFYSMQMHALRGIVWQGHKLVLGRSAELFDLRADPGEQTDLASTRPEALRRMREALDAFEEVHRDLGWGSALAPGTDDRERLEALGYLVGSGGGNPLDPALPDPRERIGERRVYDEAQRLWNQGRALERRARTAASDAERERLRDAAREAWHAASRRLAGLEAATRNPLLLELVGKLEIKLDRPERAVAALERLLASQPGNAAALFNLGLAHRDLGDAAGALAAFRRAHALEPRQPRFALMIARQLADAGERDEARAWLERAREGVAPGGGLESSLRRLEAQLETEREES